MSFFSKFELVKYRQFLKPVIFVYSIALPYLTSHLEVSCMAFDLFVDGQKNLLVIIPHRSSVDQQVSGLWSNTHILHALRTIAAAAIAPAA